MQIPTSTSTLSSTSTSGTSMDDNSYIDDDELGNCSTSSTTEEDSMTSQENSTESLSSGRSGDSESNGEDNNSDYDSGTSGSNCSNKSMQSNYYSETSRSGGGEEGEVKSSFQSMDTPNRDKFDDISLSGGQWSHKSAETQDSTAGDIDTTHGCEHISISGIICVTLTIVLVVVACIITWQKADEWFPFLFEQESSLFKETSSSPSMYSTTTPSWSPTMVASVYPSVQPTKVPSLSPSSHPTLSPTGKPSIYPTEVPTSAPSMHPTSFDDVLLGMNSWDQVGGDIFNLNEFRKGFLRKSFSFSDDGNCLAIGHDSYNEYRGYVRIFSLSNSTNKWEQIGDTLYDSSEALSFQIFGNSIVISNSCQLIVIGGPGTGYSQLTDDIGKVYIYHLENGSWSQSLILESNTYKRLGASVDMVEHSGNIYIAIAASPNVPYLGSVAIYHYSLETKSLTQVGNHILEETEFDKFGESISMSGNGMVIAVGASKGSNSKRQLSAGYVKVYEFRDNTWIQKGQRLEGSVEGQEFGLNVQLSEDASLLIIGSDVFIQSFKYINDTWYDYGQQINGRIPSLSLNGNLLAVMVSSSLTKVWVDTDNGWEVIRVDVSNEPTQDNIAISGNGNYVAISYLDTNVIDETGVVKVFKGSM
jgi:hypothetical protein